MKKIKIFATLAILVSVLASCSSVLDEHPRTFYEPGYFSTDQGVEGGLAYMYVHLRYMFGHEVMIDHQEAGTDEFTWAESATDGHHIADMNPGELQWSASQNPCSSMWTYAYRNINTANGVLENGEANGVDPKLLAEVRFFRAFDYFYLVQTFGGVPLDLGSGELKFNAAPSTKSYRNTVDEVYDKCIIPDFEYAIANLPETPRKTGAVTKTTARLYLAKAYLTYAWWNLNPENIPTYPETSDNGEGQTHQVVRSASNAPGLFQKAYDTAMAGINNPGPYGLLDTYYDVWRGDNGYNKEVVLFADHTYKNHSYNGSGLTGYQGGDGQNSAFWMMNPNYTNLQIATDDKPTEVVNGKEQFTGGKAQAIGRAGEQGYGRPWARMAPVHDVFYKTFADLRDSRLDVTFNLAYKQNATRIGGRSVYGAMRQPLAKDAVVLKFIPNTNGLVTYPSDKPGVTSANGANGFGAGTMEGENAYVIEYNHIGRRNFVGPWKRSIYLPTSGAEVTLKTDDSYGQTNIANPTPNIIARFAEFYFVAAEAAIKLNNQTAAHDMMKVIRSRAGNYKYSVAEGPSALEAKKVDRDYSAELVAAIPAEITIDWLLDEYSREFFAEYRRWYDLVRTQTWIQRASTYLMGEDYNKGNTMEKVWKREIDKHHYLRPIPVSQLNGLVEMDKEWLDKYYQNPGYDR